METDDLEITTLKEDENLQNNDSSQINISDVIEVIQTTDPSTAIAMFNQTSVAISGNGTTEQILQHQAHQITSQQHSVSLQDTNCTTELQQGGSIKNIRRKAFVRIIEQPAGKALRFRYECEGRSAGSIPGVNSTPENKTFPSIEIVGYKGRAVVVVSCVTKDSPYRPHPHNLVGKEGCKKGVCTVEINSDTMRAVFSNLGIQCVKKKDIESALRAREEIRVDPFKTGFSHRFQPSSIDLNSVRLCFQVFLESEQKGRFTVPLPPVVSEPIYDKKAMSDLVICTLCSCSSTVAGSKEIILLCEKVAKEDISIRFFEEKDGQTIWEAYGDFQHADVHKQTAIKFRTPKYRTLDIEEPVKVFIQLRRPSDGATSESLQFDYIPLNSDPNVLKRKRQKLGGDPSFQLLRHFQSQETQQQKTQEHQSQDSTNPQNFTFLNISQGASIKQEPRDTSPQPYTLYANTALYRLPENSPSPQPLSPSNSMSNTPSPYSVTAGGNLLSPNNQYTVGSLSPNINNPEIVDFTNFQQHYAAAGIERYNQLQQQQQQQQQWNLSTIDIGLKNQISSINEVNSTNFNVNNIIENSISNVQHHLDYQQQQQQWNIQSSNNNNNNNNNGVKQEIATINNNINSNNFNVNELMSVNLQNQTQSTITTNINLGESGNLSNLLDMDSEQLMQFNSAELSGLSLS